MTCANRESEKWAGGKLFIAESAWVSCEVHAGSSRLQARESEGESQVESCPKVKLPRREILSSRWFWVHFTTCFFFEHGWKARAVVQMTFGVWGWVGAHRFGSFRHHDYRFRDSQECSSAWSSDSGVMAAKSALSPLLWCAVSRLSTLLLTISACISRTRLHKGTLYRCVSDWHAMTCDAMQCHAMTWHAIFLLSGIFNLFNSTTVVLRVSCRQHDDGETDSQETEEADLGSCHCKNNFEHLNIWHITLAIGWNDGLAIGAGACWAGSYHHAEYHEYHGGHLSRLCSQTWFFNCCRTRLCMALHVFARKLFGLLYLKKCSKMQR